MNPPPGSSAKFSIDDLKTPPAQVYKCDRRSRVWRVDTPHGTFVVKRYEYSPLRQLLAKALQVHPAQRERRWERRLTQGGLRIVPIVARGTDAFREWTVTGYVGPSLLWKIRDGDWRGGDRHRITGALGAMIAQLIQLGYFHRDLKTSNILFDDQRRLWLIDVGAFRRSRRKGDGLRMLAILDQTARDEGATRADRLRCLRVVLGACPQLGTLGEVSAMVLAFG